MTKPFRAASLLCLVLGLALLVPAVPALAQSGHYVDGALHVVARILGESAALRVAAGEEYDWKPDGKSATRYHAPPK